MYRRPVAPALLAAAACLLGAASCSMFDPTYGMTPEEKEAYLAEKKAEKEAAEAERKVQEAAFRARSPDDMTSPGEGHDEDRNAEIVGQWTSKQKSQWISLVLLKEREGWREWSEELTLFDNGSYAYRMLEDKRYGTDSKGREWSMDGTGELTSLLAGGPDLGQITRGQWKTEPISVTDPKTGNTIEGEALYFRTDSIAGYGEWTYVGAFELIGGNKLTILNDRQLKADQEVLAKLENPSPLKVAMTITKNTMRFTRR